MSTVDSSTHAEIFYCSNRNDWSSTRCGPDCPGTDHLDVGVPAPMKSLVSLINAVRLAHAGILGADSDRVLEMLERDYVEITGHDIAF